jgi:acetyl esterase/lipase
MKVWLDMDQAALDVAYDQNAYAPNREQILARNAVNSERARARLGAPRRFAYGPTPIEALDIYPTARAAAPINVFMHGGAWRGSLAKNNAIAAELFVNAGAHYVVPDFAWVQDVGGSLFPMADQVRRAVAWVYRNAEQFGGDPRRLYVSGFSSGAHLAGVLLTTDWAKDFGLPADMLKGGLCCSGMFDLKPVRLSSRSRYVAFTDEMEQALSPQRHLDKLVRRSSSPMAPWRRRSSSASRETSPRPCGPPASGSICWSATATTTSSCTRRWRILTGFSAGPSSRRCISAPPDQRRSTDMKRKHRRRAAARATLGCERR